MDTSIVMLLLLSTVLTALTYTLFNSHPHAYLFFSIFVDVLALLYLVFKYIPINSLLKVGKVV